MTEANQRRLLFLGLWLTLPWPMLVFGDAFVPAVRYVLLAAAAAAVGLREGVAGSGPLLIGLFVAWALGTTLATWIVAWLVGRLLVWLGPRWRVACLLGILVGSLALSLLCTPYSTPFGRTPRGGLVEILS